jgi:hypothetical protein
MTRRRRPAANSNRCQGRWVATIRRKKPSRVLERHRENLVVSSHDGCAARKPRPRPARRHEVRRRDDGAHRIASDATKEQLRQSMEDCVADGAEHAMRPGVVRELTEQLERPGSETRCIGSPVSWMRPYSRTPGDTDEIVGRMRRSHSEIRNRPSSALIIIWTRRRWISAGTCVARETWIMVGSVCASTITSQQAGTSVCCASRPPA